jgi:hypothetical protein
MPSIPGRDLLLPLAKASCRHHRFTIARPELPSKGDMAQVRIAANHNPRATGSSKLRHNHRTVVGRVPRQGTGEHSVVLLVPQPLNRRNHQPFIGPVRSLRERCLKIPSSLRRSRQRRPRVRNQRSAQSSRVRHASRQHESKDPDASPHNAWAEPAARRHHVSALVQRPLQYSSRTGRRDRTIAIASSGVPSVSAASGNHLIPPFRSRRIPSEKWTARS